MIYGNKAAFVDYHTSRGRDVPGTWDDDTIDAALLVASEWIDGIYGAKFSGQKTGGYTQEREWPRSYAWADVPPAPYVFPDDEIPDRIINATYEAAWRQATTPGSLQVDYTPNKYTSVSVEGAISVDYAQFSQANDVQTQFAVIDTILYPLLTADGSAGGSSAMSGGARRV